MIKALLRDFDQPGEISTLWYQRDPFVISIGFLFRNSSAIFFASRHDSRFLGLSDFPSQYQLN